MTISQKPWGRGWNHDSLLCTKYEEKKNGFQIMCHCLRKRDEQKSPKGNFNWAARGDFYLRWGDSCTHSGYHKTLSPTIAWHRISCEGETYTHLSTSHPILGRRYSNLWEVSASSPSPLPFPTPVPPGAPGELICRLILSLICFNNTFLFFWSFTFTHFPSVFGDLKSTSYHSPLL